MGRLKGDAIECGYHGLTFDCSGQCVRIPGQPNVPANARVRSYPVVEKMGLAWIWMGDPALADRFEQSTTFRNITTRNGARSKATRCRIDCHYLNLADNLCDPAHVSFVHLSTLGSAAGEDMPVHSETQGEQARHLALDRRFAGHPAVSEIRQILSGNVDRWHYYHYTRAEHRGDRFRQRADRHRRARRPARERLHSDLRLPFITPIDAETCMDHWMFVKNFQTDEATTQAMIEQFRIAFTEDKAILEAIQRNEKEPRSSRPVAHRDRRLADARAPHGRKDDRGRERASAEPSGATAA